MIHIEYCIRINKNKRFSRKFHDTNIYFVTHITPSVRNILNVVVTYLYSGRFKISQIIKNRAISSY